MASDPRPLDPDMDADTRRKLFNELDYGNMHGTRPLVTFPGNGTDVPVPHGFAFTPTKEGLTLRTHLAMADIGTVYMTRDPDAKNVYLAAPRSGSAYIEISHPSKTE